MWKVTYDDGLNRIEFYTTWEPSEHDLIRILKSKGQDTTYEDFLWYGDVDEVFPEPHPQHLAKGTCHEGNLNLRRA